ncbi:MFS general substrate transporter, partial [Violaceomyces palustris]
LPAVDKGRGAFTFLALATLLETNVFAIAASYGSFQDYHLASPKSPLFGASASLITITGAMITLGTYFGPFLFLSFVRAYPEYVRIFLAVSASACSAGHLLASIRPTPTLTLLFQGVMVGLGAGAFSTPSNFWLPQWFDERRGLATGVMYLGSGIGGVIFPFLINWLLQRVGFAWTMRVLALILSAVGVIIVLGMRPRLSPKRSVTGRRVRNESLLSLLLPHHPRIINTPLGLIHGLIQLVQAAAYWSISYYISPYATSLGMSSSTATLMLALLNVSQGISYVIFGRMADRGHLIPVLILSSTMGSILVSLLLGFSKTFGSLISFSILYGLTNGGFATLIAQQAREMAKIAEVEVTTIFVEYLGWRGTGGLIGPLICSTLY